MIRESDIEKYLVEQIKKLGGRCDKWVCPGRRHVPDRIVLMPKGRCEFVELKAPGKKPTAGQTREHERLRAFGFNVWVIGTKAAVDAFVGRFN